MLNYPVYFKANSLTQWVDTERSCHFQLDPRRDYTSEINEALKEFAGAKIISVEARRDEYSESNTGLSVNGLPNFLDVRVEVQNGGHSVKHTIWLPLSWNGRFLGCGGAGNRTTGPQIRPDFMRIATLPCGIMNGFAVAITDGGNQDPRPVAWAFDTQAQALDWELIRNWAYRSTHDMTVIAKAIVFAVYKRKPIFSYFQGGSGGGRQAMAEVQRYPEDYDGVWAAEPAINWTKFTVAGLWPAVVQNEFRNALSPAKLEAFRQGVLMACGTATEQAQGYFDQFAAVSWSPHDLIGVVTTDGQITESDTAVMARIWDGPRDADGTSLWFGLRPGVESWGVGVLQMGLVVTKENEGVRSPVPFFVSHDYVESWVLRDPGWRWQDLTIENFPHVFARSVQEFEEIATDDPDLSRFKSAGGKLILSHGADDELIFAQGTVRYYEQVTQSVGGSKACETFARLFISPGDRHCHITAGPGPSLASGMIALMEWVEYGIAPQTLGSFVGRPMDSGKSGGDPERL